MFKYLLVSLVVGISTMAAIPTASQGAKNILKYQGALNGGVAGTGFSLLKMSKMALAQNNLERWVIDIGDIKGRVNKGVPGFYHVQLTQNPSSL